MRCNNWQEVNDGTGSTAARAGVFLRQLNGCDWLYALVVLMAAGVAYSRYGHAMDGYEQGILAGSALGPDCAGLVLEKLAMVFPAVRRAGAGRAGLVWR